MLEQDNTKRSQVTFCDRKFYWQYIRNLRPNQGSTALRYGITWHAGKDAFYNYIKEYGWTTDGGAFEAAVKAAKASWEEESAKQTFYDDYRTLENYVQALILYTTHFSHDEGMLKVVATERPFKLLMNLTSKEEKDFPLVAQEGLCFTGKIDAEVLLNGRLWQLEQKTTGQALSVQSRRLHRSPQLIGYSYAGRRLNPEEPPDGSLVVLHHLSSYKSKKTGEYGKLKVEFERIPQIFTDGDFDSWRITFLDSAERVLRNGKRNIWPMQQDNCYQYGRCSFAPLCEQNAELGEEILEGFYEEEPWDVAKGVNITE